MTLLHRVQGRQGAASRIRSGVRAHVSTGARGAEGARGTARHHHRVRRSGVCATRSDVFGAYLRRRTIRAIIDLRAFIARAQEQTCSSRWAAICWRSRSPCLQARWAGRVVGTAQRLGVPMGRRPSRGVSGDARTIVGRRPDASSRVGRFSRQSPIAWRCRRAAAHPAREGDFHICTAQALLANIAAMYACTTVRWLTAIARRTHASHPRWKPPPRRWANTAERHVLRHAANTGAGGIGETTVGVKAIAERAGLNFRYLGARNRHRPRRNDDA